jgi:hypothetical protein
MTQITYDVIERNGGWCVACAGVVGPPYYRKTEAINDVLYIAKALRQSGSDVRVFVEGVERPAVRR